jgi:hypothetical protein
LTAAPTVFIIPGRGDAYAVHPPIGVVAMIQKLVAGLVLVALMIMVLLAYAQEHEGCLHGRSIKNFKPCGSLSSSI